MDQELRELIARLEARGLEPEEAERAARAALAGPTVAQGPAPRPSDIPKEKKGMDVRGGFNYFMDKATLGFWDEFVGAGPGIQSSDDIRADTEDFRENASTGTKVALSVAALAPHVLAPMGLAGAGARAAGATAAGATGAARAPAVASAFAKAKEAGSLWQATKTGGLLGAAYGAAGGLGNAEGNLVERLPETAMGAGVGTVLGAAVPGLLHGIGTAARSAGRGVRDNFMPEAFAARLPKAMQAESVERVAGREIIQRFLRDGKSEDDIARWVADAGADDVLADAGGAGVRSLAAAGYQLSPDAQVAGKLHSRAAGEADRLTDLITEVFAAPQINRQGFINSFMQAMKEKAKPLYDEAYNSNYVLPQQIQLRLGRLSESQGILAKAKDLAILDGSEALESVIRVNRRSGALEIVGRPDARASHYILRALREVDGTVRRAGQEVQNQSTSATESVLGGFAREIREDMGSRIPSFQAAQKLWAGGNAQVRALEEGSRLGSFTSPRAIEHAFDELKTPAEQNFFRMGFLNRLQDDIGAVRQQGRNLTERFFGAQPDGSMATRPREALEKVFGTENAQRLISGLATEANRNTVRSTVVGNSATANRLNERSNMVAELRGGSPVDDVLGGASTDGISGAFRAGAQRFQNARLQGMASNVSNTLLRAKPQDAWKGIQGAAPSSDEIINGLLNRGRRYRFGSVVGGVLAGNR